MLIIIVCTGGIDLHVLLEAGYSSFHLDDVQSQTLMHHFILYRNVAVMDQLKSGLAVLGIKFRRQ